MTAEVLLGTGFLCPRYFSYETFLCSVGLIVQRRPLKQPLNQDGENLEAAKTTHEYVVGRFN
jgi:hypothetical protein